MMHVRFIVFLIAALFLSISAASYAEDAPISSLRTAPLGENAVAPRLMPQNNTDRRQVRNYPEQPPVIPHKIDNYQVDLRVNKCLTCHDRRAVGESQAPMVSVTHYMDRDGQFLATISPRRYFCNQCHVPQLQVKPIVQNNFIDIDEIIDAMDKKK